MSPPTYFGGNDIRKFKISRHLNGRNFFKADPKPVYNLCMILETVFKNRIGNKTIT
jgi:hypothetical protein